MLDPKLISTLQTLLSENRNEQRQLIARLRDAENEVVFLREEIQKLDRTAEQLTTALDDHLGSVRSDGARSHSSAEKALEADVPRVPETAYPRTHRTEDTPVANFRRTGSVAYLNQGRGLPLSSTKIEPISQRFADRTITQACTLLLREAGVPLHVNELYNLLVAGGMEFKGNNPTISVAVSLNRNRRFRKVGPGTFDLVMREASQAAS